MKTTKKNIALRACVVCVVLAISIFCEKGNTTEATNATDYSIPAHWLSCPLPATTNKEVDVFYLYPTSWTSTNNAIPEICAIDNPSMLQQAPVAFSKQATAFEPIGNIFAPFYRQGNLTSNAPAVTAGIPTTDAMAAFDYYIQHFNHGRPFILAGHSQGANVLNNLLAQYMKTHPAVLARMIAAYVIGFPVTAAYLTNNPFLKFAEGADDTGVIISYNTQAPKIALSVNPVLWGMVGTVINPLTWSRSATLAVTNQGFGSFMPNSTGAYVRVPQYADARIDITHGVLICSTADNNALAHFDTLAGYGIYHNFDYPFYYYNIRSNAANRTQIFLNAYYSTSPGVCADYDGDGKADPAVYDEATGTWKIKLSSGGYCMIVTALNGLGGPGYASVSADYDRDGKADPAVYQEETGTWKVLLSSANYAKVVLPQFLGGIGYSGMPADYDGDGKADPAVYQRERGDWKVLMSSANYYSVELLGLLGGTGYRAVAADYDGDKKADPAVYSEGTPSTGSTSSLQAGFPLREDATVGQAGQAGDWKIMLSGANYSTLTLANFLGGSGYIPFPADYDGDQKADPAVKSTIGNEWIVMFSSGAYTPVYLTIPFE